MSKSTIILLRDKLQSTFNEVEAKNQENAALTEQNEGLKKKVEASEKLKGRLN
jgi:hypothetical protein